MKWKERLELIGDLNDIARHDEAGGKINERQQREIETILNRLDSDPHKPRRRKCPRPA